MSETVKSRIELCQGKDRHRFLRRLHRLRGDEDERARLLRAIDASIAARERRAAAMPTLNFPNELPVSARRAEIAQAIRDHAVVIVCGETGSGKTTQLPKICLEVGRGVDGLVGHTQPRRLAARAVAARIAEEMNTGLGLGVGFQTRFQQRLGEQNLIKVMTDGILLAEIQRDPWLNQYDTIILDEAHERSLNIDFLLGYLKQLLRRRRDLKLIVTSATLDVERIGEHFDQAPVIAVEGRTYPVELRYRPLQHPDDDVDDLDLNRGIENAIDELQDAGRGDVLVFLPGEREIREVSRLLRHLRGRFEIHALYARLSPAEQQRIFQRGSATRIILSTNVAETSLTVPGIRYVIDTGTARISRYSWRAQIQRLPVEKISRASAAQRAGRCGRTAPGICVRLYAEDDFLEREEFTQPEIQRTNLAAVILQMASLRLGDVENFPFIDPPDARLIRDGYRLLNELQAVGGDRRLTAVGKRLARLPIDPRLGRMLLAAAEYGSLGEVLIIVTALAVQDPRDRPYDKRQAADEKHARFTDKRSDFASLLRLWDYLEAQSEALSQSALRRVCLKEFINFKRWREWRDLHRQLKVALKDLKLNLNARAGDYEAIHRALLSGLLDHIGCRDEKGAFTGSRNRKFYPFPGSALRARPPKWVMAAEITETTRVYARTLAGIQPLWIEQQGNHLLRRQYSEPHWQKRAARAGGYEKVLLNGLVIHPRRRIDYVAVDPDLAREIFIRHALVHGEWDSGLPVVRDNQASIASIEDLEVRTRRRDILVDEMQLYNFYAARIPRSVHSGAAFKKWYRALPDPAVLRLSRADLVRDAAPQVAPDDFPEVWRQDGIELPLRYCFEPGSEGDGVTLTIPLALVERIDAQRCEWLVPGLLEEKIVALLRALPKRLRKNFIPVPDFARAAVEAVTPCQGGLLDSIGHALQRMTAVEVPQSAWSHAIEPHLLMRFAIAGEGGDIIATGRDLERLAESLRGEIEARPPTPTQSAFERNRVNGWSFGPLPERLSCVEDGYTIERFPALSEEGDGVALRLFDKADEAAAAMRSGLRRLIMGELKQETRYLEKNLPDLQRLLLLFSPVGPAVSLKEDIFLAAIERCFLDETPIPRNAESFADLIAKRRGDFVAAANVVCEQLAQILALHAEVRGRLTANLPWSWIEAARDIQGQIDALVYPGFLAATPSKWLRRMPRYFDAILMRMQKLDSASDRDRLRRSEIEPLCVRLTQISAKRLAHPERLVEYRWLLEELRVSLFAQELGALEKVSVKRLDKLWNEIC